MTSLIKQINFPSDLRKFKKENLKKISDELREELIDVVSETGGHLGAGSVSYTHLTLPTKA